MSLISEIFNNLHFIRPMVLWSLPIVLFIIWQLQKNESKDDGWSKICDPHLLDAIKIKSSAKGNHWSWLLWPIGIISVLAIAGPAYKQEPSPVIKNQSALIIALDVSRSMLADDIKPNRLERAKFKINDILEARKDGQTALVVYAGDAFVVTPLTDDTETIALMLKAISPEIMPVQGSRVDIALNKSQELLTQAGYTSGEIILISDGVNSSKAESVAQELSGSRINTSVLAVGTEEGAPIPSARGFVKDKSGNIVIPKLQISALRALSSEGNGRFAQISGDSSDIEFLMPKDVGEEGESEEDGNLDDEYNSENYIDEGPWLALLLLPLMVLLFRKGILLSLFLVVGLQSPQSSYALDWDDLWMNADQQAAKHIKNNQAEAAYEVAKSDNWKATAAFRNEDYSTAQNLFVDGSADGFYNQGNALAASGQFEEAIESYNKSLEIRPDDEDTLYNKKKVEEALEQQKQQEQQEQQDQENQEQQEQDKQDQESQDQQQGDEEQQEQDGEQQDGEQQDGEENQDQGDNPEGEEQQEQEQGEMTEEQKKEEERKQKELEEKDQAEQENEEQKQQEVELTPEELAENAENKEAIEQWLRRIPDDPGGLLRRKFYYQYNQQNTKPDETDDW